MTDEHAAAQTDAIHPDGISHAYRHNRRTPEVVWRLQDGTLTIEREGQGAEKVDLARAAQLRICKAPSPWDPKRFRCDLVLEDGTRHTLCSSSWIRWGRYENRDENYVAMVRALALAVAEKAPGCRITGASQPWAYWTIGGLVFFAVVLGGALLISNPPQAWTWDHFWGLAVPLCMLGFIASVLGFTVPEPLKADDLDERFLPRVASH